MMTRRRRLSSSAPCEGVRNDGWGLWGEKAAGKRG